LNKNHVFLGYFVPIMCHLCTNIGSIEASIIAMGLPRKAKNIEKC